MKTDKMLETLISLGLAGGAVWAFFRFVVPKLSASGATTAGAATGGGCSGGVCYDDLLIDDTPQNAVRIVQQATREGVSPAGIGGTLANAAVPMNNQTAYVMALEALDSSRQRQLAQAAVGTSGGGIYRDAVLSHIR